MYREKERIPLYYLQLVFFLLCFFDFIVAFLLVEFVSENNTNAVLNAFCLILLLHVYSKSCCGISCALLFLYLEPKTKTNTKIKIKKATTPTQSLTFNHFLFTCQSIYIQYIHQIIPLESIYIHINALQTRRKLAWA